VGAEGATSPSSSGARTPAAPAGPAGPNAPAGPAAALSADDLARKVELEALLREHRGNITAVAEAMGKARVQIRRWMKRYGLSKDGGGEDE
jgi:DNA-binding NtrC family response regulator